MLVLPSWYFWRQDLRVDECLHGHHEPRPSDNEYGSLVYDESIDPAIDVDPIDQLKANIIEILSLYALLLLSMPRLPYKSDDVYRDYFNQISTIIWNILQNKSYLEDSSHRSIYVNGLKFINAVWFPSLSRLL